MFLYDVAIKSDSRELIDRLVERGLKKSMILDRFEYVATYKGWVVSYMRKPLGSYIFCDTEREFEAIALQTGDDYDPSSLFVVLKSMPGYKPGNLYQHLPLQSNIHPSFYRRADSEDILKFMKKNQEFSLKL